MNAVAEGRKVLLEIADLKVHFEIKDGKQWFWQPPKTLKAVDGVTLRLYEGETLGVVGESGCGKSTFARAIIGLVKATDGHVAWLGKELLGMKPDEWRAVRSDIQMIFQDPYSSLNPVKKVGWILEEPLRLNTELNKQQRREKVLEMLKKVGLDEKQADRYPRQLSGGQRQRVCIAESLMLSPRLLIADEPVSALDVTIQAQVISLLRSIQKEMGLAILFISHDMRVVYQLSQRVMIMKDGEIVESGDVDDVYFHPEHPYTKRLLEAAGIESPGEEPARPVS